MSAKRSGGSNEADDLGRMASLAGSATGTPGLGAAGVAASAAGGGSRWMGMAVRKAGMAAMAAGGKVSALTGGALGATAGTGVAFGGMGLVASMVVGLGASVADMNQIRREPMPTACTELVEEGANTSRSGGSGMDADENMEAIAQDAYSVLSYAGMSDENISGILGNWSAESGMDPTGVERIYDEPYEIGPKKQVQWDATSAEYPAGFANQPTGIGLGQWTWDRATKLIEFAEEKNLDWYTVEAQLAYMMDADSGAPVIEKMIEGTNPGADDPVGASVYFHDEWERSADSPAQQARRGVAAGEWYAKMGSWTVDTQLGASILALVGTSKKGADRKAQMVELAECSILNQGGGAGGNSSAAEAMVSISWPFLEQSKGNDGTDIYMFLHDEVFPGDPYYASCDRGVGTAVRWSGTDDNFKPGAVAQQEMYVNGEGRDKWEKVGSAMNEADLKPGDVLIAPNHIEMYVGEEAVKKVWPNEKDHQPDAVIGHASLNDRSPGLDGFTAISGDGRQFEAYRSKGPEKNSKFTDIKIPAAMKPGVGNEDGPTTTPPP